VEEKYDLKPLLYEESKSHDLKRDEVLNGIAYNSATGELLVTGKNWANVYHITL
jgi:glutamine cyclotransferase